jgi:hypothetical protein
MVARSRKYYLNHTDSTMDARNHLYHGIVCISIALASLAGSGPAQAQTSAAPVYLTLSPGSMTVPEATLTLGQTQKLMFLVDGLVATDVTWSLIPNLGNISGNVYTAPVSLYEPETVILYGQSGGQTALAILNLSNTSAPAPLAPLTVAPSSATLSAGQTVQFSATGVLFTPYLWTISPPVGSIANGLYTAPATITSAQTVTVTAINSANAAQTGVATVSLAPTAPPIAPPKASVTPTSANLNQNTSKQFAFLINGVPQGNAIWSAVPPVGSVINGLYTAPASVTTQTSVTLIATSETNSSLTASSSVTLIPSKPSTVAPVSITVVPGSVTLTPGESSSFIANVTGTSNTSVTWSMSPPVGTLNNGIYTAPATVTGLQTVILTATSNANPSSSAKASVVLVPVTNSMSVSPAQVSLSASKTQQFTAAVTSSSGLGGSAPPSVTWSISPVLGSISSSGVYTAPSSISSQQTVTITATSTTLTASASVTLTPSGTTQPTGGSTSIVLPVEIMGPAGTTSSVTFNIPSGSNLSGQLELWLQIHGLKYQTEASVQVNGGSWLPINNSTVTLLGSAAAYGGIGGGFSTLTLTMNLPAGSITSGKNTLTFQFNGTDGVTSGFRVLNLNVLASGSQLISQSSFTLDDPSTWQPPLNDASDISTGETLWKSAHLINASGSAIQAHCGDCHTADGRDLKYFNYSNNSIQARAVFHGLSAQQGQQIASYIRSLNTPAPSTGRPWNPVYQPGPGLDSQPVENWAAGAGLDAVLDSDADMVPYLMPGGSTANLSATGFLNQREVPLAQQLLDWNHWLPTIHPLDAWGATFTSSKSNNLYLSSIATLVPNSPSSYKDAYYTLADWSYYLTLLQGAIEQTPSWSDPTYVQKVYSTGLWSAVKFFEVNQVFGLEGMPQVVYGSTAELRAWYGSVPFMVSPVMLHIPGNSGHGTPGIANGTGIAYNYIGHAWDQLQLILNDGNGHFLGASPMDFDYAYSAVDAIGADATPQQAQGALMMEWLTKALQQSQFDSGPQIGSGGWNPTTNDASQLVMYPNAPAMWTATGGMSASQRVALMNSYLTQWIAKVTSFTPAQFAAGGWAAPIHAELDANGPFFGDKVAFIIPQFLYWGADRSLINQVEAWAKTIWPTYNWNSSLNATCAPPTYAGVLCSNDN